MPRRRRTRRYASLTDEEQEYAARRFSRELTALYATGSRVTAKAVCTLSHWASRAGAGGIVSDYAMHPNQSPGNYQKHFDRVVGDAHGRKNAMIRLPMQSTKSAVRTIRDIPARPVNEILKDELFETDISMAEYQDLAARTELPASYHEHPVVRLAPPGSVIIPLALFVDAGKYGGGAAAGRQKSLLFSR